MAEYDWLVQREQRPSGLQWDVIRSDSSVRAVKVRYVGLFFIGVAVILLTSFSLAWFGYTGSLPLFDWPDLPHVNEQHAADNTNTPRPFVAYVASAAVLLFPVFLWGVWLHRGMRRAGYKAYVRAHARST